MEAHCFLCEVPNDSLCIMPINCSLQRTGWQLVVFEFVKLLFIVANICCTNMLLNVCVCVCVFGVCVCVCVCVCVFGV